MKSTLKLLSFVVVATFTVSSASAAAKVVDFAKVDTNKDGQISEKEFKAAYPSVSNGAFVKAHTGTGPGLSKAEYDAWAAMQK